MTFSALIRNMAAAGATVDAIALAVEAIECAQAEADAPRAAARERKRRQRERDRERDMSRDSHVTVTRQERDEPAPAPSPLSSPQPPQQTPHPHPHPEGTDARTRKVRSTAWPCPEGVDPAHWTDMLANRKSKRLANTATAHAGVLRDLAKFSDEEWPPGRIVQHAAERGWGAIFDPRPKQSTGSSNGHRDYSARRSGNGMLDAIIDLERADRAGAGFRG